jgi:1-acyl-sn-glycerol-3-phosphate acyltransferase
MTPGINRAIILPEVSVKGLTLEDLPALKNEVYSLMENCIIEYRPKNARDNRS